VLDVPDVGGVIHESGRVVLEAGLQAENPEAAVADDQAELVLRPVWGPEIRVLYFDGMGVGVDDGKKEDGGEEEGEGVGDAQGGGENAPGGHGGVE